VVSNPAVNKTHQFVGYKAGVDPGFLERGANLRQQSLGWRCTPSLRSMLELGGLGACPPTPRKILKINAKILQFMGIFTALQYVLMERF